MAQAARDIRGGQESGEITAGRAGKPTDWLIGWRSLFWGSALVMVANIFLWFWDYEFAFSAVLALGAYIYAHSCIPALYSRDKGFPWSFFLLIAAAVLECMEVAFNEWGHSLLISEEFFAVPFHWPFVAYGWLAGGMFAVRG